MEQTLEQKILGILNDDKNFTYSQLFEEDVFTPDKAAKELHKLFIQEKINLLEKIKYGLIQRGVINVYIEELTNQLNQLQ
jgi:hypothetical protein